MAERSGRDERGIAGGSDGGPESAVETAVEGRAPGSGGGSFLFSPKDKADRLTLSRVAANGIGGTLQGVSDWAGKSVQ